MTCTCTTSLSSSIAISDTVGDKAMPALKASSSRRSEALAWFTPATDTSVLRCADSTKNAPAVTPAARNSFNRSCRLLPLKMVHIKGEVRRPYLAV
ncbi:hypothetical protein T4D_4914 [Trichinella pseudospiralis]|uniref:Uncharacterized protein n=1 Tax=Trichinella pseudospiralis TaxID=6337 RepID=A0A0V1FEV4_TRIPS|nr:hypothetical protein T4D_4914 [Trichinella pseudospiralis]